MLVHSYHKNIQNHICVRVESEKYLFGYYLDDYFEVYEVHLNIFNIHIFSIHQPF